jgi:hypothetical protein
MVTCMLPQIICKRVNIVNIKYHYNSHSFNIMVTVVSQVTVSIDTTLQGFGVLALFDYLCLWRIFTDIVRYA